MRYWLQLVVACAPVFAAPAGAHAFLDHASPAVGSTVHATPTRVRLWFTQELESAFSTLQVSNASGQRVDKADVQLDPADATLLSVSLPPLAPGRYRVTWRVLSVDTHATEGDFTFDVAP
ncbi:MAG TPA: copper resistance CopC family protein [Casimicrobiaceae bacterium]|nr:copper resistance CopC family protein [Casimicrobiaceae bacterium]